jgi:DNA ligase-1
MDSVRKGSGLAIRFPRFTGNYRPDKAPEDATASEEILEMYRNQLKKIGEAKT